MFMKQIFIKVALVLRFGRFADFGYQRQRRMLCGNSSSPETVRTKSGVCYIGKTDVRNGSFRNFAETCSAEHSRSMVIHERFPGIPIDKNTNPRRPSNFSLFIRSTTAAFFPTEFLSRLFPSPLSALFGNLYPVWRSA